MKEMLWMGITDSDGIEYLFIHRGPKDYNAIKEAIVDELFDLFHCICLVFLHECSFL